jgi:hypothetical protein
LRSAHMYVELISSLRGQCYDFKKVRPPPPKKTMYKIGFGDNRHCFSSKAVNIAENI